MDILSIFVLSLIQGVTEFLPVSSSGHLVILPLVVNWESGGLVFDTALHFGTLLAVMVYFRSETRMLFSGMFDALRMRRTAERKLFLYLSLSTVPIVVAGCFFASFVEGYARCFTVVGWSSIIFGFLLWWADRRSVFKKSIGFWDALIFGLFQVLAMVPGTSRSGICMTAGRLLGLSRTDSTRYSFLMAIPVILIASLYGLVGGFSAEINWQTEPLLLFFGVCLSFVSALLCIHVLMGWVEKIGFLPFVVYRIVLGSILVYLGYIGF